MRGWKTITGAVLIGLGGVVQALQYAGVIPPEVTRIVVTLLGSLGGALGVVGIGHKIDKGTR